MKASEDKNLEKLIDKIMKDVPLETPSFDFTSKVMSRVLAAQASSVTVYKPLISKSVFMVIFGSIFMLFGYFISNGNAESAGWLDAIDYGQLFNTRPLSGFQFSKITLYAVVLATVLLFVQISLLKNHFDKRFEV